MERKAGERAPRRRLLLADIAPEESERLLSRQWLLTNGLGGYASGTVAGRNDWRYHALLVAALPPPLGRVTMLDQVEDEVLRGDGGAIPLSAVEHGGLLIAPALCEFSLETGLPIWRYVWDAWELEKRLVLVFRSNTVRILYRLVSGPAPVRLRLRPMLRPRPHNVLPQSGAEETYHLGVEGERYSVSCPSMPELRLHLSGASARLTLDGGSSHPLSYALERSRGHGEGGTLWSPGHFEAELFGEAQVALTASTEPWETFLSVTPDETLAIEQDRRARLLEEAPPGLRQGEAAELVLAADQFLVEPVARALEAGRVRARGDEPRSVIAGYPWFTDWGRDTMISLEGLALLTGRQPEAGYILRTFASYLRDGLIPNLFPETEREGLYHTADATLWYIHAVGRYLEATGDRSTLEKLLPVLTDIMEHHFSGTRFGIRVDGDGLLTQGELGYQLTWMDAKVGDWVVTPRRGKAVELNALWYNALRLLQRWLGEAGDQAGARRAGLGADTAQTAFNQRFFNPVTGCLYDVVDGELGDDASIRPNQLLAISLPHAVLDPARWESVLLVVARELVTPVGLRSLAPSDPQYQPRYDGDLRARDAAYHQGTVWAWLIGPYVDAWLRVHPRDELGAAELLAGLLRHLGEACLGQVSEIFDGDPPFHARGCPAQAWSVAEVLRSLARVRQARER